MPSHPDNMKNSVTISSHSVNEESTPLGYNAVFSGRNSVISQTVEIFRTAAERSSGPKRNRGLLRPKINIKFFTILQFLT
jgi:hypothetical protein